METSITEAVRALDAFVGDGLTRKIAKLEDGLKTCDVSDCRNFLSSNSIGSDLLSSAYVVKKVAAQINVVVHAIGILLALPQLLNPHERIVELSLGAGNTGKPFDLETSERVAEFKFIDWQGGPEVIRQNALFKDFYQLAEHTTPKQKYMYVIGTEHPLKFFGSGRSLRSVMSRNTRLWEKFTAKYRDQFATVAEYYSNQGNSVILADITPFLPPVFSGFAQSD